MYAIIATGGKQYKVSEAISLPLKSSEKKAGEKVTFDQVLAVSDNGIKVGSDVANASVEASVVKEGRGKKSYRLQVQEKDWLSQEKRSQTGVYTG